MYDKFPRIVALVKQSGAALIAVGGVNLDHPSTFLVFAATATWTAGEMKEGAQRLANPQ